MALAHALAVGNPEPAPIWRRSRFDFTPAVLASYPTPNYVNPEQRGPAIYIFNSLFFTVTLTCAALRLYTRIWIRKYFGLDDLFLVFALVGAIGVTAVVMLAFSKYYWDRHVYDIPMDKITPSGEVFFASKILWYFTSNNVRASVMCLYYRLIDHIGLAKYRWVLHVNSFFIFGLFVSQIATTIFACRPIDVQWIWPVITTGKCIDNGAATFTLAVINTFSEVVVAALPLPVIMSLNVSKKQRQAVMALLCGGFLVVIVGCVRSYYVWTIYASHDPSWWAEAHWLCSEVEMDVAIMCACAPALMPMLSRVFSHGLCAANKLNSDYAQAGSNFRARKARSLLNQLKTSSSTMLTMSSARSGSTSRRPSTQATIDLEGISNDGLGYTVTINTGHGTKVRRRWDIRNKTWHYYPEEPVLDLEEDESKRRPSLKSRNLFSRGSGGRKKSQSLNSNDMDRPEFGIQKEKSYGLEEMLQVERPQFDHRNSYLREDSPPGKDEVDIEIALQIPEVEVSDWSLFDGEINRRMAARILPDDEVRHKRNNSGGELLPSAPVTAASRPTQRRKTSYEEQRYTSTPRRSTIDSSQPWTYSSRSPVVHKASHSYDNIRMGVLPSPSTMSFGERAQPSSPAKRSVVQMPAPPSLPPAARAPRGMSPAVRPLNSSQVWVNSAKWHQPQRDEQPQHQSLPTQIYSQDTNGTSGSYATAKTDASGARVDRPGRWDKSSMHSSTQAEDGSGETPVPTRLQPPRRELDDESSDEEFSLPLQRPSPRNSQVSYGHQEHSSRQERNSR